MRALFIFLMCSCLGGASADLRTWFLVDGKSFEASFVALKGGKVSLMNKEKRTASFPVKNLSIVDRAYLKAVHEIPLKALDGGNVYDPELRYSFRGLDFKSEDKFQVKGENYKVTLSSLITPHFIFFHESDLEVRELAEMMERIWYSHAFRTPHFIDLYGEKRRSYFYVSEGEDFEALSGYYVDSLDEKPTARELNNIVQNWNFEGYKVKLNVPDGFVRKYGCENIAQIQKNSSKGEYLKSLLNSAPFFMWQELFLPGLALPQNRNTSSEARKVSAQGFLALVFANEMRLQGNENKTDTGVATSALTVKYPPQGKPKEWGRALIKSIKDEEIEPSFDVIYDPDAFARKEGSVAKNLIKTHLVMAIGRFLEKDLDHMIKRCYLTEEIEKTKTFPSRDKLAEIYGYDNSVTMDKALEEFILKENMKL